jgi:hypothetical protein
VPDFKLGSSQGEARQRTLLSTITSTAASSLLPGPPATVTVRPPFFGSRTQNNAATNSAPMAANR